MPSDHPEPNKPRHRRRSRREGLWVGVWGWRNWYNEAVRRVPLLLLLTAAFATLVSMSAVRRAFVLASDPFPAWMTDSPRWYEATIHAAVAAVVAIACLAGLARRATPPRRRWQDRKELQVVLYSLAVALLLSLPISVAKTMEALNDNPPWWGNTFVSAYPLSGIIDPAVGVVLLVYDRRRLRRERWWDDGRCPRAATTSGPRPPAAPSAARPPIR
jgi:hypothetical protein